MAETNQTAITVTIRLPYKLKEKIDRDVTESGEYTSAAQWYLQAIREYLEKREIQNKDGLGGGGGQAKLIPLSQNLLVNGWGITPT